MVSATIVYRRNVGTSESRLVETPDTLSLVGGDRGKNDNRRNLADRFGAKGYVRSRCGAGLTVPVEARSVDDLAAGKRGG
jgi:hypothetical protein